VLLCNYHLLSIRYDMAAGHAGLPVEYRGGRLQTHTRFSPKAVESIATST
jgi:hypothetical protein